MQEVAVLEFRTGIFKSTNGLVPVINQTKGEVKLACAVVPKIEQDKKVVEDFGKTTYLPSSMQ